MTRRDALDRELEAHFDRERSREASGIPAFARVLSGRPVPRRRPPLMPVLVGAVAVAVALGLYASGRWSRAPAPDPRVAEWRSPTDFLLDVAGTEFLETVPTIGPTRAWPSIDLPPAAGVATRRNQL